MENKFSIFLCKFIIDLQLSFYFCFSMKEYNLSPLRYFMNILRPLTYNSTLTRGQEFIPQTINPGFLVTPYRPSLPIAIYLLPYNYLIIQFSGLPAEFSIFHICFVTTVKIGLAKTFIWFFL